MKTTARLSLFLTLLAGILLGGGISWSCNTQNATAIMYLDAKGLRTLEPLRYNTSNRIVTFDDSIDSINRNQLRFPVNSRIEEVNFINCMLSADLLQSLSRLRNLKVLRFHNSWLPLREANKSFADGDGALLIMYSDPDGEVRVNGSASIKVLPLHLLFLPQLETLAVTGDAALLGMKDMGEMFPKLQSCKLSVVGFSTLASTLSKEQLAQSSEDFSGLPVSLSQLSIESFPFSRINGLDRLVRLKDLTLQGDRLMEAKLPLHLHSFELSSQVDISSLLDQAVQLDNVRTIRISSPMIRIQESFFSRLKLEELEILNLPPDEVDQFLKLHKNTAWFEINWDVKLTQADPR